MGGHGGFGVGLGGHGFVGGFGLGGGHGLVGGFGGGLVTTGGTMTGGTMTGGTTTGGTTTGGTTTGGTVTVIGGTTTGGTTTGGTTTGGTFTGSGTPTVMVVGFDRPGGVVEPVVGGALVPDVETVGVGVTAAVVDGLTVVTGVTVDGAGLADGVGVLVAVCSLGTTISELLPPACGVEPRYEPATG